ncbi:Yip1 domain protein [Halalkalicoccus paucihalophilus]|uniref:Yip1 domain protein n=1 Tax=Halalkalicoccus paucihalophilus TaxID=1008153 RepID=A0A151AIQ7_9EURY|nr:YIP1 family protein [Halalkalicoccus paucihalophilus]KYH27484.1 Yip1 domain protein [Halalkalicoccus paucihalophilus]
MDAPHTPLVRPKAYFARDTAPSLARGALVVALNWLAVTLGLLVVLYFIVSRTSDAPPELLGGLRRILPELVIVLLVGLVVTWLAIGGVIHLLAGGEESFGETLAVVAWGYAPDVLLAPITVVAASLAVRDTTFDATSPATYTRDVEAFIAGSEGTVGIVLAAVVAVWSAYIWTYGVAQIHGIETIRAGAIAGLVALVGFVLSL